jgi:hypothetical protein
MNWTRELIFATDSGHLFVGHYGRNRVLQGPYETFILQYHPLAIQEAFLRPFLANTGRAEPFFLIGRTM